jgi:formylglycine-generating enzyme required for sulfatase activity
VSLLAFAVPAPAQTPKKCPSESIKVGNTCIDKYEASVWQVPPSNTGLVRRIQQGKATLAELTAAGAVQLGCTNPVYGHTPFPSNFPRDGNWTPVPSSNPPSPGVYAVSIAGVKPTACISWFRANQACLLSGKRLPTSREWQGAAAGTPDPGATDDGSTTCATLSAGPVATGSRTTCASSWGVADMVGNVWELVADWADQPCTPSDWNTSLGISDGDVSCFGGSGGPAMSGTPNVLIRGGNWDEGVNAGVFAVLATPTPLIEYFGTGFRCAR